MILQITDQYLTLTTFLSYLSVCFYYVSSRMCVLLITLALFSLHIGVIIYSHISFIANTFGIGIQQYAVSLSPTDMHAQQSLLSNCLSALHSWFCHNGLALNSTKSESIRIGTCQRLHTLPPIT